MASYCIYRRPDGTDEIVIRDGFSWPAAVLGPVWALWHGLWIAALALIALQALIALLPWPVVAAAAAVAQAALVGWHALDLRVWRLERDGYRLAAIVLATSGEEAERRALARPAP
ncbi:MAG: DUF2628 domain-containing protein [Alphaproteobacteria bacterium]|nr:DUF2628 domain-containing protein [Alphaproteobacteria bacterium]